MRGRTDPGFPVNREFNWEFFRFAPRSTVFAPKTLRSIKGLKANSRSGAKREFGAAETGINSAEPGITGKAARTPATADDRLRNRRILAPHRNLPESQVTIRIWQFC